MWQGKTALHWAVRQQNYFALAYLLQEDEVNMHLTDKVS